MKPQDLLFIILLIVLLRYKNAKFLIVFATGFLILAIPLYYLQTFFTAQRFVEYFFFLLFLATILFLFEKK